MRTEQIEKQRQAHHTALEQLTKSLNPKCKLSGLAIWRKLRRIEGQVNAVSLAFCNADGGLVQEDLDKACDTAKANVQELFGKLPPGFFVNRDPRGYALKLEDNSVPFALERDWGGYQILAPEIN